MNSWIWNTIVFLLCMWNFLMFLAYCLIWWEQRKIKYILLEILKLGPVWPDNVAPLFENTFQQIVRKIRSVK